MEKKEPVYVTKLCDLYHKVLNGTASPEEEKEYKERFEALKAKKKGEKR